MMILGCRHQYRYVRNLDTTERKLIIYFRYKLSFRI